MNPFEEVLIQVVDDILAQKNCDVENQLVRNKLIIMLRYRLRDIALTTSNGASLAGRDKPCYFDVERTFRLLGIRLSGLQEVRNSGGQSTVHFCALETRDEDIHQGPQQEMNQPRGLRVGRHIPKYLPPFPPEHTYKNTKMSVSTERSYATERERLADLQVNSRKALNRFYLSTEPTMSLAANPEDDPELRVLSTSLTKKRSYLEGLKPRDDIYDVDIYEFNEPPSKKALTNPFLKAPEDESKFRYYTLAHDFEHEFNGILIEKRKEKEIKKSEPNKVEFKAKECKEMEFKGGKESEGEESEVEDSEVEDSEVEESEVEDSEEESDSDEGEYEGQYEGEYNVEGEKEKYEENTEMENDEWEEFKASDEFEELGQYFRKYKIEGGKEKEEKDEMEYDEWKQFEDEGESDDRGQYEGQYVAEFEGEFKVKRAREEKNGYEMEYEEEKSAVKKGGDGDGTVGEYREEEFGGYNGMAEKGEKVGEGKDEGIKEGKKEAGSVPEGEEEEEEDDDEFVDVDEINWVLPDYGYYDDNM